jgi:putative membrane protein
MEGKINLTDQQVKIILYVMYAVGIIGHLISPLRDIMLTLTPFTLLFTGGLVLYKVLPKNRDLIQWMIVIYIVTFSAEVFGVKTGLLFGEYRYGEVLGPQIWETPLIIGMNWVLIIMGTAVLLKRFVHNGFAVILLAPMLAVIFDFFLEPVAMQLGYWNWMGGVIPIQNYLAWFAIALLAVFYFVILKIEVKSTLPIHYLGIQTAFFFILNIAL